MLTGRVRLEGQIHFNPFVAARTLGWLATVFCFVSKTAYFTESIIYVDVCCGKKNIA